MEDQMADLVGKSEPQPVLLARILIDVLVDANALKIFGQEAVDIDLFQQSEDRDRCHPQLEL
jgi:hypothetical protein